MRVGIVGASGYAGGELLRLLAIHPEFEASYIAAGSNAGEDVTAIHSHLSTYAGRKFSQTDVAELSKLDLIFLALPHGESSKIVENIGKSIPIIDLGADYRLSSKDKWDKYYGGSYAGKWVYGLPELPGQRSHIENAKRIANPGCYATAISLGLIPALQHRSIDASDVTVVAASGTTGAGRSSKASLSASEVMNSLVSYKFGGIHQHTPEIEEALGDFSETEVKISFTPILAPMPRGILATVTAKCFKNESFIRDIYHAHYQDEKFVQVLPKGQMPETSSVIGSNFTQIQVAVDEHTSRLIVSITIDNLGKGAAGQAIQNANLISGFPEDLGLSVMGIGQ